MTHVVVTARAERDLQDNWRTIAAHNPRPATRTVRTIARKIDLLATFLEIKSVERLVPLHESQLLTYLRVSGCRVGLLMNFNCVRLKDGLRPFVL